MTTKIQGNIGLGQAIAFYTMERFIVCMPLNDAQAYDLVVDDGNGLRKIQVKTTRHKDRYGRYVAALRTCGGNQSFNTVKHFNNKEADTLFIVTAEEKMYEIPCAEVSARASLTLGSQMDKYVVVMGSMLAPLMVVA